jgi:U6 snRNA-associated Sm-like protein LSm4
MLVELKNGETLNGHLVSCDTWMNLTMKEVVQTSPEADKFVRLPEVYVKGNNVRPVLRIFLYVCARCMNVNGGS